MSLLEVKNLFIKFNTEEGIVHAVRGVSFHVDEGESVGIVGESGCGKSVTMLSLVRLLSTNALCNVDTVNFMGEDIRKKSLRQMRGIQGKSIGMIFQDPMISLNPLYSIGNQLCEPLKIHMKLSNRQAKKKALEMLNLVGIPSPESRFYQYPHQFSGGMRQRVMIGMALICYPKLLIADEPTTALDVTIQAQILELMNSLKSKLGMSILMITHDLGVIANICSRVIVMYGGLIVESANVFEIYDKPAHPYTQGLLNSILRIEDNGEKLCLQPIHGSPPNLMYPPKGCPFYPRCKYAMKICRDFMPNLIKVSDTQYVACWLFHTKAKNQSRGD